MGGEEQALASTEEACRVYVGNLLPKAKEAHLTSKFSRFGTIHSVWIARRPPGFAFVRFATPEEAQGAVDACQEEGSMEILGKAVRVQLAGDKDMKHSTASPQQANSNDRTNVRNKEAMGRESHDRKSRSPWSRDREPSEGSRRRRYRNRNRSRSRDLHRVGSKERHHRRSRSRSYCRERYGDRTRSRSRSEPRRNRSRTRRRGPSRSRSRSPNRGKYERTRRSRSFRE